MDRYNNWQDRRDDRSRDNRRQEESQYRGAYRLDDEGQYSNRSRQNDMDDIDHNSHYKNHGGDYVYRRSRNLQDNDGYTEHQYQRSYRGEHSQQGNENSFGGRYEGRSGMRHDQSRYDEHGRNSRGGNEQYGDDYGHRTSGNFDGDYHPDNYPQRPGENYGNMAGSLSYGYDGGRNSDPDYNRRYNPLTGELRQPQGNQEQRQSRRYGPPDRTASNPDYDRY